MTARIVIEVTSDVGQGRLRFRLQCFRTDAITGRRTANSCEFSFDGGNDAF